jgi:PAS domain S-box-containing protein
MMSNGVSPVPENLLDEQIRKLIATYGAAACHASLNRCSPDDESVESSFADSILEASFDATFVTDGEGGIQRTNEAAVSMFGYEDRSQLLGRNISAVIGGPHAERHSGYFAGATQDRIDFVLNRMRDVTGKRRDGTEFPVQVGIKILESQGKRTFVAYCHDLSRHKAQTKKLEEEKEAIQQQQRLNRSILDSSFDAIILTDAAGKILQINSATLKEFGYDDVDQLIGKNVAMLIGGGHGENHSSYMKRFQDRGGSSRVLGQTREVLARRKDGTEFPCRIGLQKVPNTDKMVGFVRNVSSEKEAMELAIEKRAAEELLLNMLPPEIAMRLKKDPSHIADHFASATILFADIVGFTKMSNSMDPVAVVQFLNNLFSRFDEALDKYSLNKVKTIGDCYMVTSIPGCRDTSHACAAVCHFALDMIRQLEEYNKENPQNPLSIRVGINSGPVVAGVVGTKRFLYDLWGDAVNIASRMESTGVPGRIQVTQDLIDEVPDEEFVFEKRGSVAVKGIGDMETFFLVERKKKRATDYWDTLRSSLVGSQRLAERFRGLELLNNLEQIDDDHADESRLPEDLRKSARF